MKDLGKILEYQENDIEFRKIDAEFNKNPDKKKLDSAKRDFDGVQREFSASVTEAERLGKEIEQAYAESKAAAARIDELEKAFMAAENGRGESRAPSRPWKRRNPGWTVAATKWSTT